MTEMTKPVPDKYRGERPVIRNVLADRYASTPMVNLFTDASKIRLERDLWITVMQAQTALGMSIPQSTIDAYIKVRDDVDLVSIRNREIKLKHDEKARIEEFNALAGHESIHEGLTSRDMSDNVEQAQIKAGLTIIRDRTVATLARFARIATENSALVYAGRTHNVPAQPSVVGKLFADAAQDLLIGFDRLETLINKYPLRGIKGAMGTQTDQLQLLDGDTKKVDTLEKKVAESLGFENILESVGQVYPRSLDYEVVSALYQLVSGPASLALTLRLMAGNEEFAEGFNKEQVGSSAMPHKMNPRTLERIRALKNILSGHVTMVGAITGEQWFAGSVDDSATRRVAIPDAFFTTDGIFQSMLTVLDEGGFFPAVIDRELERYLPLLTTTRLLMAAVKKGVGRETAHAVIKEHAVGVGLRMREKGTQGNNLIELLASDKRLGMTSQELEEAISSPIEFVGSAPKQISKIAARVEKIVEKYPEAAAYVPEKIL